MINPMDLTGKQILVTGASSGIGRQTCITLSQLGAKVILIARNKEKLEETISMMEGEMHKYYVYDLLQIDEIESLINQIVKDEGKFDGFVHCAGVGDVIPLKATTYKMLDRIMKVHLYSFVEIIRIITKKKNINEGASIVGISSMSTKKADKGKVAYCTAKGAMDSSIMPMAIELGISKKIRINTINPGWVRTDMYHQYIEEFGEERMREQENKTFLGVSEVTDVANVIAYLLSPASSKITGQSIVVDGGFTLW